MDSTLPQIFRYGVVGIVHNGIGYLAYLLITWAGVDPKLTVALIYPVAAFVSFLLNKKWTFSHEGVYWLTGTLFVLAHLLSMLLNIMLLYVFHDRVGFPHQAVQFSAIFICALFLFVAFKFVVFRKTT